MTDLEEVWDNPQGDVPADLPVQKPRRRIYNWKIIADAKFERDTAMELLAQANTRIASLEFDLLQKAKENANQRETVRVALDTAEHAVPRSPSVVAYCVVAGCAIVGWELLAHLVAAVTP